MKKFYLILALALVLVFGGRSCIKQVGNNRPTTKAEKVDLQEFWRVINTSHAKSKGNRDTQMTLVHEYLENSTVEEITDFIAIMGKLMYESDNYNIRGALAIIEGIGDNMSEQFCVNNDNYLYFRIWLISCGENTYNQAMENADSLAEIINPGDDVYFELLAGAIMDAYFNKAQTYQLPKETLGALPELRYTKGERYPVEQLPLHYPMLWEKFNSR